MLVALRMVSVKHNKSGQGKVALTMAAAMLLHKGRQWGNHNDNDNKEEVVEEDCGGFNDGQIIALALTMHGKGNDRQNAPLPMAMCGKGNSRQVSGAHSKCKDG